MEWPGLAWSTTLTIAKEVNMRTVTMNGSELVNVYSGIVQHECGRTWSINWQMSVTLARLLGPDPANWTDFMAP